MENLHAWKAQTCLVVSLMHGHMHDGRTLLVLKLCQFRLACYDLISLYLHSQLQLVEFIVIIQLLLQKHIASYIILLKIIIKMIKMIFNYNTAGLIAKVQQSNGYNAMHCHQENYIQLPRNLFSVDFCLCPVATQFTH